MTQFFTLVQTVFLVLRRSFLLYFLFSSIPVPIWSLFFSSDSLVWISAIRL